MGKKTQVSFLDFNRAVLSLREREGYELAIIGVSLLDVALVNAIGYALQPTDEKTRGRILDDNQGFVGAFGSRADMAYALGLITKEVHSELDILRTIRNGVAHSFRAADLDEQPMSQHIDRLALINISGDSAPKVPGRFEVVADDGAKSFSFDGEIFSTAEVTAIADQHGEIGFFVPVPMIADTSSLSRSDRLRFSIMSACLMVVAASVYEWALDTTPDGGALYELVPLSRGVSGAAITSEA